MWLIAQKSLVSYRDSHGRCQIPEQKGIKHAFPWDMGEESAV